MPDRAFPRVLLLVAALSISAPAGSHEALDRAFFIGLAASVIKVEARIGDGSYSLGTGVAIAPGRVVTNCHVTRNAIQITLVKGSLRRPVVSQNADLEHDLCLLNAPSLDAPPVTMGSAKDLRVGQRVAAMGFTGGVDMGFREGFVHALHPHDGSQVIRSSTAFTSGASGGALFDQSGRLVGILTFRLPGPAAHYYSAPSEWIARFPTNDDGFSRIGPLADFRAFWQRPESELPFFMRAALLEADGNWPALLNMANTWASAENTGAEPWIARGKAYLRMDRREFAADAFLRATAIEPASGEAWFNLGLT